MRFHLFIITGLITVFCSCQVQNVPQDPCRALPSETPAQAVYHDKGDFGKNGSPLVIRGQHPLKQPVTVDPKLADNGLQIIANQKVAAQYVPPGTDVYPHPEYLTDGGDKDGKVRIDENWNVYNLETEDTVAHFDTLDGRTLVEPSNKIQLYAPRFGAVRKITGVNGNEQITALTIANNQTGLDVGTSKAKAGFTEQEIQTGYAKTRNQLSGLEAKNKAGGTSAKQGLVGYDNFESVMLYSNLLRQQKVDASELAFLAKGRSFAKGWQGTQGIKVRIDALAPSEVTKKDGAESIFQIDIDKDASKTAKLRLIKVADKQSAQPGEIVEFSLRFDNVGNQPVGNVTILDNLTTRLEFIPDSAKSSVKSGFAVQPNDAGSFTLRFEITDPLEPGQFGVIQFQCRVR
ncbi:MAG: hypothetical protein LBN39_03980 [Planctomycetaceae bacterium]|jgi:uncharacterized repeat protein (TIGR01451 family)|nr:hypothetical protein [Planctomycetaceae bacterium]